MKSTGPPATRDVPPKATLFCPTCDHQSGVDGDWRLAQTRTATRYLCPDCGTEITSRPTTSAADAAHSPSEFVGAGARSWEKNVRAWQSFWLDVLAPHRTKRSF